MTGPVAGEGRAVTEPQDGPLSYDPPTRWDDPRVCKRCAAHNGSWSGTTWYAIKHTRSNRYHSGGAWGVTDCGVDATGENFLWPE